MESPLRFSSCRGVSFEIKPHSNPFGVPASITSINHELQGSKRNWIPWNQESLSRRLYSSIRRSESRPSGHFCDYEFEATGDENGASLQGLLEEGNGKENEILIQSNISIEKQPKAAGRKESRLAIILLDQGLFTVYKRLFVLCLTLNVIGLVLAATGNFPYARNKAALFSIGNVFSLTLCRSEALLRVIFWVTVKVIGRSWVPLPIKTATTSLLQSLGGIHSGCGVSSVIWLTYALVLALKDTENISPEIIAVTSSILSLLFVSSLSAFPLVRHLHHNVFERTHRFAGWAALGLLWAFIMLKTSYDPKTKSYKDKLGSDLVKQEEFWFTSAITILIALPWLTIRCVPVSVSSSSGHASVIKFQGGVKAGIMGRISPSPLSEWHAFGIISDGKTGHMMLAGAVGDFTNSLVTKAPSHLWVRQVYFAGLPYLVNLYERVLLVATGSGICVFLSFLLQPCRAAVRVLWVTKGIEQNYGTEIKDMISRHPSNKVIVHDTAVLGRPNVSEMSVEAAREWGAEVVIVTSNPEGSRDVVGACKANGIPAFGPIWDS
ncbi:hypothetical protein K2173_000758 [Erythroxylum novogranatense]|uniref:Adenylate-forming reductase n=1 Tax=Erythroxylum novogranatense TaxID=1862640 RepID=A0AAV8T424_9ROSI|nr:hypothetical protein K2173_000758 [Erythroxylum novogranatense]